MAALHLAAECVPASENLQVHLLRNTVPVIRKQIAQPTAARGRSPMATREEGVAPARRFQEPDEDKQQPSGHSQYHETKPATFVATASVGNVEKGETYDD